MRLLLLGSGGREHTGRKIAQSHFEKLFIAGNPDYCRRERISQSLILKQ